MKRASLMMLLVSVAVTAMAQSYEVGLTVEGAPVIAGFGYTYQPLDEHNDKIGPMFVILDKTLDCEKATLNVEFIDGLTIRFDMFHEKIDEYSVFRINELDYYTMVNKEMIYDLFYTRKIKQICFIVDNLILACCILNVDRQDSFIKLYELSKGK